jgi:hypothetical protein
MTVGARRDDAGVGGQAGVIRQGQAVTAAALLLTDREQRVVDPLRLAVLERPHDVLAPCQEQEAYEVKSTHLLCLLPLRETGTSLSRNPFLLLDYALILGPCQKKIQGGEVVGS